MTASVRKSKGANRPRIAMIVPTIDRLGGAERQVLLLAKGLAARGWPVTLIALSGSAFEEATGLRTAGVSYLSLGMRKAWIDPRGWRRYLAWHRVKRPAIIHAHLPHAVWFARWVRLLAPVPVTIDTIHTSRTGSWLNRLGSRISRPLSSHTTCVSGAVWYAACAAGMISKANTTVLPNGVELPLLIKQPPTTSRFHWVAVGRLAAVKDYPTMLQAFALLPVSARLAIAGSGPEDAALRQIANDPKIMKRIDFAGFQTDIQPLLAEADGFVLSSLWEGLPISVLEAQAASLPVVATSGAGTAEAMMDGTTGFLVKPGDAMGLAAAMARVMAMSYEERVQMGAHGRQFVEANFSIDTILDRWEMLYLDLLARNREATWLR
jgi:glycosyltransferase involved in cell wall biosynthesis